MLLVAILVKNEFFYMLFSKDIGAIISSLDLYFYNLRMIVFQETPFCGCLTKYRDL